MTDLQTVPPELAAQLHQLDGSRLNVALWRACVQGYSHSVLAAELGVSRQRVSARVAAGERLMDVTIDRMLDVDLDGSTYDDILAVLAEQFHPQERHQGQDCPACQRIERAAEELLDVFIADGSDRYEAGKQAGKGIGFVEAIGKLREATERAIKEVKPS